MNDSRASKPVLAVSLLLILCIGLAAAIRMAGSAPTYDGRGTDVAALQQDARRTTWCIRWSSTTEATTHWARASS